MIKIRCGAHEAPMMLSNIDDQNLKDSLTQRKDTLENTDDKSVLLCTGMIFDFHNIEYEIAKVKGEYMIAKSTTNDVEMEFRHLSVASSACAEKLEYN